MAVINPQNLRPALADQESNILTGQLTRRDEINQAIANFEAQTGTSLADVLADTLALKNGNAALADATGQLRADTVQLLADLVAVKTDTADTLTGVDALPALITAISTEIDSQSKIMKNVLALNNNNRAPLLFQAFPSSGQTLEAYNYTGSGRIYLAEFAGTHSVKVYVDGNLAIDFVGNVGSRAIHDLIDHTGENKTYLPDLYFSKSLRVVVTNHEGITYYTKFYGVLYS